MRRSGKVPSRIDLASYFASHLNGDAEKAASATDDDEAGAPPSKAVPAVYSGIVPSKERSKAQATRHISFAPAEENAAADMAKPIPAAFGGRPQPSPRRPPPEVMDYTVKAGVRPAHVRAYFSHRLQWKFFRRFWNADGGIMRVFCTTVKLSFVCTTHSGILPWHACNMQVASMPWVIDTP